MTRRAGIGLGMSERERHNVGTLYGGTTRLLCVFEIQCERFL